MAKTNFKSLTNFEEPKRLTPKQDVVRRLYLLSGNECAKPGCESVLIDSHQTMIGEIAHIASAMPTGKRFDENMTNEDRCAFKNLLLLCPTHHTEVDGEKAPYDDDDLIKWKADHERRFEAATDTLLKKFASQFPDAINDLFPTKPATFAAFQAAMDEYGLADEEIAQTAKDVGQYVDELAKAPPEHRDFMLSVLKGAIARDSFSSERPSLLCDEVVSAFGISVRRLKELVATLEKYGLAWFDEDFDSNPTVELHNPSDVMSWGAIAEFAGANGVELERFLLELKFGDLD